VNPSHVGKNVLLGERQYRLDKKLGEGGTSIAYQASPSAVVKISKPKHLRIGRTDGFDEESTALKALAGVDSAVPKFYGIGQLEGTTTKAFVMEFRNGKPLGPVPAWVLPRRPETAASVARVTLKLATALERIHARGWFHGSIHPGNILRSGEAVTLLDFELSARIGSTSGDTADVRALAGVAIYLLTATGDARRPQTVRQISDLRLADVLARARAVSNREPINTAGKLRAELVSHMEAIA
jgi:serine/threonine protein kinase